MQVMEPRHAVALVLVMSVVRGVQGVVRVRHAIEPRRLAVFLIPALFGIPIGLQILEHIDARTLKLIVAGFLLTYGLYFIWRRNLPSVEGSWPLTDGTIGFVGGVLGAIAGLSGALPAMWFALRPWPRHETRAVLQPFNVGVLSVSAILLLVRGVYTAPVLAALVIAVPTAILGSQLGLLAFRKISDSSFRWLLIALMFVSGIVLLIREVF